MTNLAALLQSEPDEYSDLSGKELFRDKVKRLAVMGGKYPTSYGTGFAECNFCGGTTDHVTGSRDTYETYSQIPSEVEVVFSGFEVGIQVQSGARLSDCASANNPCRAAYIDYEGGTHKADFMGSSPYLKLYAVLRLRASHRTGYNVVNSTTDIINGSKTMSIPINLIFASQRNDASTHG